MAHILQQPGSNSNSALKVPDGLLVGAGVSIANASLEPQEVYHGKGKEDAPIRLRISNGAAGQSGFIGAWANAFIDHYRGKLGDFGVAWYIGDTTESIGFLAAKQVDVAITYNEAAEKEACRKGIVVRRVYGFDDHFYLVGPKSDPAHLRSCGKDVYTMFNRIVDQGNKDLVSPPKDGDCDVVRFLSRFDKSATNIKENELFCAIGQVPWALAYSKWYHQYPRFPIQALWAASVLHEYTLTDRGTWLSSTPGVRSTLDVFAKGEETKVLLDPARVLLGNNTANADVAKLFLDWVKLPSGGQKIARDYEKDGQKLYTPAPTDKDLN